MRSSSSETLIDELAAVRTSHLLKCLSLREFIERDNEAMTALKDQLGYAQAAIEAAENEVDGLICAAALAVGVHAMPLADATALVSSLEQCRVLGDRRWPAHLTVDQMREQLSLELSRAWWALTGEPGK